MESDQFLKSLFLIILKKDSLENWEEKSNLSLTHSQFRQAKKSVSIKSHIRSNGKIDTKRCPNVKINLSPRPFHSSSTKLHNVPDPSILPPPHPVLPDLIITLQLSIKHSIDHQPTKETLVFTFDGLDSLKSREPFFFWAQKKPG